jgi:hypothetical protein
MNKPVIIFVLCLPALIAPGCSSRNCGQQHSWRCTIKPTECHYPMVFDACGSDMAEAIANADSLAQSYLLSRNPITGTTCVDNGTNTISAVPGPPYVSQGLPSCDVTATDDACVTCAKTYCCGDYQACFQDTNCSCLVGCLYQGGTTAACTSADACGPLSEVSTSTSLCLTSACPVQCAAVGGMGPVMCPTMGTGGGTTTTGTGTGCTPGSFASGDACSSDGDCASCSCNTQTMTCN